MNVDPKAALTETKTLMLDMDGTVLDLAYDNFMWMEHIPRRYAIENDMPHEEARELLASKFALAQGDLRWYCLDHWSEHLGLDVVQLHHDLSHRIGYLPGALSFLRHVQEQDIRVLMVTNSHRGTLDLKDAVTGLSDYFDGVHSSHDYGYAKENQKFWNALQEDVGFDRETTLFIDDSPMVLQSARTYGIRMLLNIMQPDTSIAPGRASEFSGIQGLASLLVAAQTAN